MCFLQVSKNTSKNHSSMLQDVSNGRRTEANMITGYVLSQAEKLGVPVPTIQLLDSLMSLIEWDRVQRLSSPVE